LHLLHNDLLAPIVNDLEVLLLDLDDLLLLVEVVEAVDEVESAVIAIEAVDDGVEANLALAGTRERARVDRLCGCSELVRCDNILSVRFGGKDIPARPAASTIVAIVLKDMLMMMTE
jgi:hypothetical protein